MRKGNAIGKKMPLDIEGWLSDPDIQAWYDDQEKWYLRLLINAWKHTENPCHLPNEPERLMVLAGVPTWHPDRVRAWKERGPAVLRKFVKTDDGKWLFNLKQVETYVEQLAKWDARRDAGSKGGKARAEAIVAKRSNATNLLDHSSSSASHSLSNTKSQSNKKTELPDWIPKESWDGFVEMRQRLRKPMTDRAKSLIIGKLTELKGEGNEPGKVLDQSTERGWQGVFPISSNGNGNGHKAGGEKFRCDCGAMVSRGERECPGCHYALKW